MSRNMNFRISFEVYCYNNSNETSDILNFKQS